MDIYTFIVENFIIHDTRSLHSDTVYLNYSAFVDSDLVGNHIIAMGDLDNGEYTPGDYVASDESPGLVVVINDPIAKVAFNFQLVNAGNPPTGSLSARLASTAQQLFGAATGVKGAGASQVLAVANGGASIGGVLGGAVLMQAFASLWSWLSAGCDGPLAVDQISGPRFVLDAWTDNPMKSVGVSARTYSGLDSPAECGASNYELTWSLRHSRTWSPVADTASDEFMTETGLGACEHNGAAHAFGVVAGGLVTHARTFTGATWYIDRLGPFDLATLPVSAVSFNDRLYLFAIKSDASIASLAFTSDGTTWTPLEAVPPALQTNEPIATTVFRDRLYMLARDSASNQFRVTSTSDLRLWDPWVDGPPAEDFASPLTAATLGETLFVFAVLETGKTPPLAIVRNSSADGLAWSGWELVEDVLRPQEGGPSDDPLDIAAGIFEGRVYVACRWSSPPPDQEHEGFLYMAVNFSEDGDNWSGWRVPEADFRCEPSGPAALTAVDNHLYIFTPRLVRETSETTKVWAY